LRCSIKWYATAGGPALTTQAPIAVLSLPTYTFSFLRRHEMKPISAMHAVAMAAGLALATGVLAQAPAGSTGMCKDGSYTSAESKKGACAGHGGVKSWTGAKKAPATAKTDTAAPAAKAPAAMAAPAATGAMATPATKAPTAMAPAAAPAKTAQKASDMPKVAAPGGGPGKVWVNTSSHVYHCSGDEWYGKTKEGAYMSEADAKAKGNHAAAGKACG
jgi:hypothetical protein